MKKSPPPSALLDQDDDLSESIESARLSPEEVRRAIDRHRAGLPPLQVSQRIDGARMNYRIETVDDGKGGTREVKVGLSMPAIMRKLVAMMHGLVAKVNDLPFAMPVMPGEDIRFIENHEQFFGYLEMLNDTVIDWASGQRIVTMRRAFEQVPDMLTRYEAVETAPHEPEQSTRYYNHPPLPKPDFAALDDFHARFCPETEVDRALIAALSLTAVWGGGAGDNPAFVISSRHGQGVGKSSLGYAHTRLLGQFPLETKTTEDPAAFVKRLLSPQGMKTRMVMFDNETGDDRHEVNNSTVASMITAPVISGHRMFHGEGVRLNNIVWIVTLNVLNLSRDLAVRAVPIELARPKYNESWKSDMEAFLAEKRAGVLSALVEILKHGEAGKIEPTRWAKWEQAVLTRLVRWHPDLAEIQRTIMRRQNEFDCEGSEFELIREEFHDFIAARNGYPESAEYGYFFNKKLAAQVYRDAIGVRNMKTTTAVARLKVMCRGHLLPELTTHQHEHVHGFLWSHPESFQPSVRVMTDDQNL